MSRYKESYIKRDEINSGIEYPRNECYHRSRGLNDCDGASTYRADKVDAVVLGIMREIFANISGCPQEEKIQESTETRCPRRYVEKTQIRGRIEKASRRQSSADIPAVRQRVGRGK